MAKVTSKLQVTVPKSIADQYGIAPGDDIQWIPAGDAVRVQKVAPRARKHQADATARRLALFDQATERQRERQKSLQPSPVRDRGWRREDAYHRGRAG